MVSPSGAGAEHDSVLHEAAQWSIELSTGDIPAERIAQWQQWLAASETHRTAFDRIQSTWSAVDRYTAGDVAWPSADELASDAYDGSISVAKWRARIATKRSSRRSSAWGTIWRRPWLTIGVTAGAIAALTALALLPVIRSSLVPPVVTVVETASGENRDVPLSDGSVVSAGAESVLWATLSGEAREVTLERGEAFFRVARDPARPFLVKIGSTSVAAVGTAFNVRRAGERIVVSVSEGRVKVDTRTATVARTADLTVGQQVSIDATTGNASMQSVDAIGIAEWREGLLQYRDEPLRLVLADLNRYSAHDIVIADPRVADLRITGTVFANEVDNWLQSLESALPVRVVWAPDGSARLESR